MWVYDIGSRQQLIRMIAALLLAVVATLSEDALAQPQGELTLTPERCVAMNEGQTCYQTVIVRWQTNEIADYCLYLQDEPEPLVCWESVRQGRSRVEFASDISLSYRLVLTPQTSNKRQEIAQATLTVSWVYGDSKKRRNSWRLF
ncbi:DUF3019 domain-containing protein [Reinekea blandensis]|uniref:DUF3019 domain-containing protein n=1 Tax=Reinekea blandensis MED297 TaxID=314283 RepID=A4BAD3_9GAMM|nr:DUF3019 domain-containing protein [Reinekea blandensis]EAR10889.1 hypothetical protein MED297_10276 [Reinekea sp. MED297] [Reinekea blandensis MED297]